ncbi:MAG: penicillin-binding transpeptidase domain-containing protein, partial [Glutamicibacter ardleyensis]
APESKESGSRTFYNFAVERSLGGAGGFQGGSTMKPYTTLAWLHEGHHMYDKINAKRETFLPGSKWKASCLPGGTATVGSKWTPKNASPGFYRTMTVDTGLYWSINSATVQEAHKVDLCTIADYTTKLGLLDQDADEGKPAPISPANPAFIIGSANITPLAQAAAFATFANKGEYCEPRAITSVEDKDGTKYKVPKEECSQEIDPQHVADLNGTLKKIATNRVSKGQVAGPIAGKTGTNDYATSTWFVGYSTGISTASWVGRLKGKAATKQNQMHGALINDQRAPKMVDSSTFAAPLWVDFMSKAVQQYDRSSFGSVSKAPKPKPKPKEEDNSDNKSDSKKEDSKKEDSKKSDDNKSDSKKSENKGKEKSKPTAPAKPGDGSND